jgi:hypothetical protein
MTIMRRDVHKYLWIELDFWSYPGTLIIFMIKYLHAMISKVPEILKGTYSYPITFILSRIQDTEESVTLCEERWQSNSTAAWHKFTYV